MLPCNYNLLMHIERSSKVLLIGSKGSLLVNVALSLCLHVLCQWNGFYKQRLTKAFVKSGCTQRSWIK